MRKNSRGPGRAAILAAVLLLWSWNGALAQSLEMEYDWGQALHQEEWYDPSDWFDSNGEVNFETDWWGTTYGYGGEFKNEEGVFSYYGGDEIGDATGWYDDGTYRYDVYTDHWYEQGPFEEWYE